MRLGSNCCAENPGELPPAFAMYHFSRECEWIELSRKK